MSLEDKLKETKSEIRSLIVSSPERLTIPKLLYEYEKSIGKELPYQEFGFKYVNDFLKSISDVLKVRHNLLDFYFNIRTLLEFIRFCC